MSTDVSTWPPDIGIEPYYSDDRVVIFNADCRDVLPRLPKVDLLLTDPPYGIGAASANFYSRGNLADATDFGHADWDENPVDGWLLNSCIEKASWQCVWGGNFFVVPPSSCWLVWDKEHRGQDFADAELAWTNWPGAVRKFNWLWAGFWQGNMKAKEKRWHPTQKPMPVMKWCIQRAPDDPQIILDTFAGSCTTAVAAKQLGRRCICIELEERYCEIGAQRCRQGVLW